MGPPAVIAIMREDDRVLAILRGPEVISPGWWTFPGGRIEPGESEEDALVREMSEELALDVTPLEKIWECDTDDGDFRLHWWDVRIDAGELDPEPSEIAEARWVTLAEFLELEPTFAGDREFVQRELMRSLGLEDEDVDAWRGSGQPHDAFVGWLSDRMAGKPSGPRARRVYTQEETHRFARRSILEALALGPDDHLLEIGCGGGLLLRDAIATGARATALDHSPDMVELARQKAPRAKVVLGEAERLPFGDGEFDAVAMSIVFLFFDDPVTVLRECRRVLRHGGRLAVVTQSPELRGTPASPEPIASRGHFHTDEELARLAEEAGFTSVRVENEGGGQLLTASA